MAPTFASIICWAASSTDASASTESTVAPLLARISDTVFMPPTMPVPRSRVKRCKNGLPDQLDQALALEVDLGREHVDPVEPGVVGPRRCRLLLARPNPVEVRRDAEERADGGVRGRDVATVQRAADLL